MVSTLNIQWQQKLNFMEKCFYEDFVTFIMSHHVDEKYIRHSIPIQSQKDEQQQITKPYSIRNVDLSGFDLPTKLTKPKGIVFLNWI